MRPIKIYKTTRNFYIFCINSRSYIIRDGGIIRLIDIISTDYIVKKLDKPINCICVSELYVKIYGKGHLY